MKKHLLILIFIVTGSIVIAGGSDNNKKNNSSQSNTGGSSTNRTMTIDASDTVVFDMSQAIINGSDIEFPVYILSDDVINALDFSFKYNQTDFIYDSIINLTTYISPLAFYNSTDSTVRFTSSSLQTYDNALALVSIRFTMLAGPICTSDLNTINVYLNGDPCSFKVVNCLSDGVQEINKDNLIHIYPNPATEILTVEAPENTTIRLMDMNGRQLAIQANVIANRKQEINIQNISNGIYLMKIFNNDFLSIKKVVIQK